MLVDGRSGPGDPITSAIRSASRTTGANFDYLLNTAIRESSLDPSARARTSSARGLYQFIESTWLTMVKEEGPKFGLGRYADAIGQRPDGSYAVRDPRARAEILKLREDPQISSVMAGALAKRNAADLQGALGRKPNSGELYLAHFLGANGAKRLIELQRSHPNASAAAAFPDAARANRSIFHRADGNTRTVSEVLAALTGKGNVAPTRTLTAAAAKKANAAAAANLRPTLSSDPVSTSARTKNGPAPRLAYAHPVLPRHSAFAPEEGSPFKALVRTSGESQSPLSPAVRELWGSFEPGSRALKEAAVSKTAGPGAIGEPLDLLGHLKSGRRSRS